MLGLLLLILKIIGIILAAIIGLIIALALIILLVPVRYRGRGSYYDKPEGLVQLTWLLHLVSIRISYQDELETAVRILGFRFFKEKGDQAEEDLIESPVLSAQEFVDDLTDPKLEEDVDDPRGEETAEDSDASEDMDNSRPEEAAEDMDDPEPEAMTEAEKVEALSQKRTALNKSSRRQKKRKGKNFVLRFFDRVRERIRRLKLSFQLLSGRVKLLWLKKEKLMAFLRDEKNRKTFHLVKRQLTVLIRHVRPGKLKGRLTFGLEDPYLMGQVLTGAALFYPFYQKSLDLTPVFEQKILEGELSLKGRVRPGVLLVIGLRLLIHKNFRVLLKRFLNQGGN